MTGQVNLNGAWIRYEDYRANRKMKKLRMEERVRWFLYLAVCTLALFLGVVRI